MPRLRPITITDAKLFIARNHRHNDAPVGGLFAVACEQDDKLCGVAIIGRPKAHKKQDGWTCEVTHLATDGTVNACTILYAAASRAALALGYAEITSLILESEPGTSLKAAGWEIQNKVKGAKKWSGNRYSDYDAVDMFGEVRPSGPKVRWHKVLARKPALHRLPREPIPSDGTSSSDGQ